MKKKVLIFAPFFTPSVKGGGPIISITNIIENLSDQIEFFVITSDRDLGDTTPFSNIHTDEWIRVGNANVYYTNSDKLSSSKYKKIINDKDFDFFYFNSFFDYRFTILPLITIKKAKEFKGNVIIAPRGEFSSGALRLKMTKKKIYIKIFKILNLHRYIIWHATAESEKIDIKNVFGDTIKVKVATNLTENYEDLEFKKDVTKKENEGNFIFLSRIHPKKNLKQAIRLFENINRKVNFSIYGPIEDEEYWNECEELIKRLPSNIKVEYGGLVNRNEIQTTFNKYHFFLFPTFGENYGHVISEALIGGCPVIISDQTPWRHLEKAEVGWDIPLNDTEKFVSAIKNCLDMSQEEYLKASKKAFNFGKEMANKPEDVEAVFQLFS